MVHLACTLEKSPRVEQRKFNRVQMGSPVSFHSHAGGRDTGTIENLSAGGCAISAPGSYMVGARYFVTIANFQSFAGKIVWANDGRFGIEFDTPLHPAIVDHIARSNP